MSIVACASEFDSELCRKTLGFGARAGAPCFFTTQVINPA